MGLELNNFLLLISLNGQFTGMQEGFTAGQALAGSSLDLAKLTLRKCQAHPLKIQEWIFTNLFCP
jgi:hypothetical protein